MEKGFVAVDELLEPHEELSRAVVPGMSGFDDPTAILGRSSRPASPSAYPRDVSSGADRLLSRFAVVPAVRMRKGPSLRLGGCMIRASNTGSSTVTALRFAPVTISDSGTPRPSTS